MKVAAKMASSRDTDDSSSESKSESIEVKDVSD